MQKPRDNNESERGAVAGSKRVAGETRVGDGEADDDEEEGEGREKDGEELEVRPDVELRKGNGLILTVKPKDTAPERSLRML